MADDAGYRMADPLIREEVVGELYHVAAETMRVFRIPHLRVVKVSFPRPLAQGSLHDRDMHAGQRHVLLAGLSIPECGPCSLSIPRDSVG